MTRLISKSIPWFVALMALCFVFLVSCHKGNGQLVIAGMEEQTGAEGAILESEAGVHSDAGGHIPNKWEAYPRISMNELAARESEMQQYIDLLTNKTPINGRIDYRSNEPVHFYLDEYLASLFDDWPLSLESMALAFVDMDGDCKQKCCSNFRIPSLRWWFAVRAKLPMATFCPQGR